MLEWRSLRRRAETEGLGGRIAVVGEPEEVAIATEARAERGRDGEAVKVRRAQENLGRVDRAGREDHVVGFDIERIRIALVRAFLEAAVNAPAVGGFHDPLHFGLSKDLGLAGGGDLQVVFVERVFGGDVAAGDTIAAIGAPLLK
jgi:hypothetical protein